MINTSDIKPMGWNSSPSWLEIKLEDKDIDYLMNIVNDAEEKASGADIRQTKSSLVGNISKSFSILKEENKSKYFSKKYLNLCIKRWLKDHDGCHPITTSIQYPLLKGGKLKKVKLESFWANHQYKYEFNPPHNHSAVYSFVIWLKIPYNYKTEMLDKRFSGTKISDRKPGCFDFYAPKSNPNGNFGIESYTYRLDKSHEGTMLFFPSHLTHQVFPFYSTDEKRITLSGNINFELFLDDTDKK
tara:strand:+ start:51 stop:779 length:729 start_codon:yes stop_codon:yes gene_type:complete